VYHCHIAGHEDGGMMAIIRVEPSTAAAAVERARLYLVSLGGWLGLLPGPNAAEVQRVYAWCIRGRLFRSRTVRSEAQIDNNIIARQQVFPGSVN
jgi:hypothetical protein